MQNEVQELDHHGHKDQVKSAKKFLIFRIDSHLFGIPLSEVREVIGVTAITPVPNMPNFFRGLINLRGKVISITDLHHKLLFHDKGRDDQNKPCIIITEVQGITLGVMVDDVSEVTGIDEKAVERDLNLIGSVKQECIEGAAKSTQGKLTLLLNLSKIFDVSELASLKAGSKDPSRLAA